jgi:hypothetical protein
MTRTILRTHRSLTTRMAAGVTALLAAAALTGCSQLSTSPVAATSASATSSSAQAATSAAATTSAEALADNTASHAEDGDADYDQAEAGAVTLADGASKADSDAVAVDGDTITLSAPGTYVLTGTLSDGQVVVDSDAEGKVRIVLAGASISSTSTSPFVVAAADEAVVVLADGTQNSLADGRGYGDSEDADAPNAALYSMADLTIAGTGSLAVTGNSNDGIASKDGLVVQSGSVTVTAVDDGIRGKDYVIVEGGTVTVAAEGDAVKSDNETDDTVGYVLVSGGTVALSAGDDGVHAEGDLAITGGTVAVKESNEGLEGATVTLAGGTTTVRASDDGVNVSLGTGVQTQGGPGGGGMQDQSGSGAVLTISGGTNVVDSDGDGLDSNGSTVVTGGTTVVNGPTTNGNGALDSNGGITVTGGVLVAAGSSGMAEAPSTDSATGWVSVAFDSPVAAGQTISVVSGDTVVASYTTVKETASLVLAVECITAGDSYDVYVGGRLGTQTTGTYSAGGTVDGADKVASVTAGEHTSSGPGGMGGPRPGSNG